MVTIIVVLGLMLCVTLLVLGLAIWYIVSLRKITTVKSKEITLKEQEDERIKYEHFQGLMNYDANQAYNRGGR